MKKILLTLSVLFSFSLCFADSYNKASKFVVESYLAKKIKIENALPVSCKIRWHGVGGIDQMSLRKGEKNNIEGVAAFGTQNVVAASTLIYVFSDVDNVDIVFEGIDDTIPKYKIVEKK